MATSEEINDALTDILKNGVKERHIGDRGYTMYTPAEILQAAKELEADSANSGSPFIKVKFGE